MGCDIHIVVEARTNNTWHAIPSPGDGWLGRDYDAFAILAGVRNGYGFAGCDTGDGFIPISSPRGLPDDATKEAISMSEMLGSDGHSHSHHTLRQMIDYDWSRLTKRRGWVNARGFSSFKDQGSPDEWCGSIFGSGILHITPQEMERRIADGSADDCYCALEWDVSYEDAGASLRWLMNEMARHGEPDDVRIVFFFDN